MAGFFMDGLCGVQIRTHSSTNLPGANLDARQRGPEGWPKASRRGAAQGCAAQSLQARHPQNSPRQGAFLWMVCLWDQVLAPSSTKSPGGRSRSSLHYTTPAHPCAMRFWTRISAAPEDGQKPSAQSLQARHIKNYVISII